MLNLVSLQPTVEHAAANQYLAPHAHGWQRVEGPMDPLAQRSLRDTGVPL